MLCMNDAWATYIGYHYNVLYCNAIYVWKITFLNFVPFLFHLPFVPAFPLSASLQARRHGAPTSRRACCGFVAQHVVDLLRNTYVHNKSN